MTRPRLVLLIASCSFLSASLTAMLLDDNDTERIARTETIVSELVDHTAALAPVAADQSEALAAHAELHDEEAKP